MRKDIAIAEANLMYKKSWEVNLMGKKWRESKTAWFNVLYGIVSIAGLFANSEIVADNPIIVAVLLAVQSIGNLILRSFTKVPIG